ncbi:MAG: exosortase system-associated protein, TIGR04073 family [Gammaproteobacteria bacterium]
MIKLHRIFVLLPFIGLSTYVPVTQADGMQQGSGYYLQASGDGAQLPNYTNTVNPGYGSEIGAKALNGITNLLTGPLEIPKNIINTSNQSNVFYGIIGGGFKGIVHTAGRLAVGLTDLVTFPLMTKPIAQPLYVWNDFDVDTIYSRAFVLQERQEIDPPVTQTPLPPPSAPEPAAPPVAQTPDPYSKDTNQKLDTLFKKEMMK